MLQLAIIWAGIYIAVIAATKTRLTPVLYYMAIGCILVNVGILPVESDEFVRGFTEIGIILIMFAIGFEEETSHFLQSIKKSWGIAFFGALAPFASAYAVADYYWGEPKISLMCGLAMTATAVSLTMVSLKGEGLGRTPAAERSTYVLVSSVVLFLLFWQWRPIDTVVWDVSNPTVSMILVALFALGWIIVFASTFMIIHFDLFGLRQVYLHVRGHEYTEPIFVKRFMYKLVRHPLMLGFLIAFWAVPTMTLGHLIMSIGFSVYIFIALRYEERDLEAALGEDCVRYKDEVPMIIPIPKSKKSA